MTAELEPRIWSHITDQLPDVHPLAFETVWCRRCDTMVHASNNECMTTWVETGRGPYCIACFVEAIKEVHPGVSGGWLTHHTIDEGEGWGLAGGDA